MKYLMLSLYIMFWVVLSENLTLETFIIGFIVAIAIFRFNREATNRYKHKLNLNSIKYIFKYIFCLIKEIFKSNLHVAKIVLSHKMLISPKIVEINTNIKSKTLKTLLANSITLTPGTLTLFLTDNKLVIHCLEKENEKDLINCEFENILLKAEECRND